MEDKLTEKDNLIQIESDKGCLISVIVPVYNVKPWLRRCVESIIKQTYSFIEIILIDDGSTDGSDKVCDILAKKDERIRVIHTENNGLSEARNTGLRISKGEYITYVDSDDRVDKNFIEKLYTTAVKFDADMVQSKVVIECQDLHGKWTRHESCLPGLTKTVFTNEEYLERLIASTYDFSAWARLYKRNIAESVEFPKGRLYEDLAILGKIINNMNKIVIENEAVYYYQYNRMGSITSKVTDKGNSDYIWALREFVKDGLCYFPRLRPKLIEFYRGELLFFWKKNAVSSSFRSMHKSLFYSNQNIGTDDASAVKYMSACRRYVIRHFSDYMTMSLKIRIKATLVCFTPWIFRAYGIFQEKHMNMRLILWLQHRKRVN